MSVPSMLRKAVVLAGGQTTLIAPLTNYYPAYRIPVLNRPLIEHTIDFLEQSGFEEVIIAISNEDDVADHQPADGGNGIRVRYHREKFPRGTAGCLKDLERFISDGPFLVLNGSLFIKQMELESFTQYHAEMHSVFTVGIYRETNDGSPVERMLFESDSSGKGFRIIEPVVQRKPPWRLSGIYIVDPSAIAFIDANKYMDIKEQLLPRLKQESDSLFAYEIRGDYRHIAGVQDYVTLHWDLLVNAAGVYCGNNREIAEGVWVGRNVTISPNAYIMGPVMIGDNCSIEDNAHIIGPAVIADDCRISAGVLFRESILWKGVSVSGGATVEYSIVGEASTIPEQYQLKHFIAMNGIKVGDMNFIPERSFRSTLDLSWSAQVPRSLYRFVKRAMDITLSSVGLLLLLPVFLCIALLIRRDSSGPVFYIQRRCGLRGKLFGMIKFRTMVTEAEKIHKTLVERTESDGPMFKLSRDPRVTRLGRMLRRTSIDELPQLFNVVKGDMSLVGPRPLITEEMKFSPSWRDIRLKVKPGITGLWQIQGRSEASFHDWIRYDIFYVKNQSLWLDTKILFKTIKVVLKKVGAY
ncbi:MAG: exopolysaccharide biosynthesis polyprenyl glycosylphosphotransferase [Nitrospirota bacterium]